MGRISDLVKLSRMYTAYLRRQETVAQLPSRVWIEPTPSCNFRCGHCPNGMDEKFPTGLMKMDLFKSIVDQLDGASREVNLFHRGESLIHPDLEDMVAYCAAKGMKTRLHTNAGLMTRERSRDLIKAGLSYISFSVDGYTKPVYDKARLGGEFRETMENIQGFLQTKKELGNGKPFTIVQVMEIGETPDGVEARRQQFQQQFDNLPLDRFVTRTPHNWAGDAEKFGHGVADQPERKRFTPCTFLWYSMTIFFNGTVAPCPQDFYGKLKVGDASRDPVARIWNGEPIRRLRSLMKAQTVDDLVPCRTCDILTRKTFMGVPSNYLSTFLKDNLLVR
ncbi:MAG: radical SAM protein [Nitrospinota bacterium]|nr:radical SAM protein [Nitrospinota bacterium]